jgi:hypothetical protein
MLHASSYLMPSVEAKVFADMPFFAVATCQAAANHTGNGVRVFS